MGRAAAVAACAVLALACQPAGDPQATQATAVDAAPPGAPAEAVARDLDGLLEQGHTLAVEWQDDPRLAEVAVALGEDGRWTTTRLRYLAADADRFLDIRVAPDGVSQQRLTLATVQGQPIPAQGLEQLPDLPGGTLDPAALSGQAADTLEQCGAGAPVHVLYATGAPVVWDGSQWTVPLEWSATITDADGRGAVVDPVTGEAVNGDACL